VGAAGEDLVAAEERLVDRGDDDGGVVAEGEEGVEEDLSKRTS
jgi:hypothetical protein